MAPTNDGDYTADDLAECEYVREARHYDARGDIEVRVSAPNPGWGLPSELHERIRQTDWYIDDLSHVHEYDDGSGFKLRLYLQPEE